VVERTKCDKPLTAVTDHPTNPSTFFDNPAVCDGGPRLAPAGRTAYAAGDGAALDRVRWS
jgi:hypothetical protein